MGARAVRKGTRPVEQGPHTCIPGRSHGQGTGSGSQWGLSAPSASPRSRPLGPLLGAAQVCGLSRAVSQVSRCHRSRPRFGTPWAPGALAFPSLPSPAPGALLLVPGETPRLPLVEKHLAVPQPPSEAVVLVRSVLLPLPCPRGHRRLPFLTAASPPWVGRCPPAEVPRSCRNRVFAAVTGQDLERKPPGFRAGLWCLMSSPYTVGEVWTLLCSGARFGLCRPLVLYCFPVS